MTVLFRLARTSQSHGSSFPQTRVCELAPADRSWDAGSLSLVSLLMRAFQTDKRTPCPELRTRTGFPRSIHVVKMSLHQSRRYADPAAPQLSLLSERRSNKRWREMNDLSWPKKVFRGCVSRGFNESILGARFELIKPTEKDASSG